MNEYDKINYGITGLIGLISGGSLLGLSTIKKLESNKKRLMK